MDSCPQIDWLNFFRAMGKRHQRAFELDLSQRNLSLGEYMELVEHATMQALGRCTTSSGPAWERELLSATSELLTRYVSQKGLLVLALSSESQEERFAADNVSSTERRSDIKKLTNRPGPSKRMRLQSAIHDRIEAIKSGDTNP
jgi:hypothetical protein